MENHERRADSREVTTASQSNELDWLGPREMAYYHLVCNWERVLACVLENMNQNRLIHKYESRLLEDDMVVDVKLGGTN